LTILRSEIVDQQIDRAAGRAGRFVKEVVLARGDVPLCFVRKRAAAGQNDRATLLLVHGFGQNRYTWHLPSRSFVNHLASSGFDVFNLDLRGHGRSRLVGAPRPADLAEYIEEDLPFALEEVRRITGRDDLYMVGHSLGGLIGYATAPLATGLVRGLVTIGSPYQFTTGSTALKVIGGLIAMLDRAGVPLANVPIPIQAIGRVVSFSRRYMESPFYPVRLRGWHAGAIEPDVLAEHLKLAFDLASLQVMVTLFRWSGRAFGGGVASKVDGLSYAERFEQCKLPLLVIAGTGDDLAPPASVEPAYLKSRSPDKSYRELPLGHIDLIVGREAPLSTWPIVERWLGAHAARDAHSIRPPPPLAANAGHEDLP
jgi:pimeloyl-ACP methyl ester carboxylesterase